MDNFSERRQPACLRLVLCILVACLAAHFLVEDTRLLAVFSTSNAAAASASHVNSDELQHQDDLAVPVSLPARMTTDSAGHEFTWTVQLAKPALPPIATPPKIASF